MSTVLALASPKGGVGKTATTLNLGYSFSKFGYKTLIVDCDPQGGIALSLHGAKSSVPGLAGIADGIPLSQCIQKTKIENYTLLPIGGDSMIERGKIAAAIEGGEILSDVLVQAEQYDIILLDTPAGLFSSTYGALKISDFVITTLQAEPIAAAAFPQLLEVMSSLRDAGNKTVFLGIALTMVQKDNEFSLDIVQDMWSLFPEGVVFESFIPKDKIFLKSNHLGLPLALLSRNAPPITRRFDQLAEEILERIGIKEENDDSPLTLFA